MQGWRLGSLEVEREDNHFAARTVHGVGIGQHAFVADVLVVIGVETVCEAVHEFQFGAQFEVRQVEVAAHPHFKKGIKLFEFEIVVALSAEIDHRIKTRYHVGAVVVEARGGGDEVESRRHIGRLEILPPFGGSTVFFQQAVVAKHDVPCTEIHGGGHTQLEVGAETQFGQYAHIKTGIPAVLVGTYDDLLRSAVIIGDSLWPHVHKLEVLQVCAHKHAEMEVAQVGIRPVLHRAFLSEKGYRQQGQANDGG